MVWNLDFDTCYLVTYDISKIDESVMNIILKKHIRDYI